MELTTTYIQRLMTADSLKSLCAETSRVHARNASALSRMENKLMKRLPAPAKLDAVKKTQWISADDLDDDDPALDAYCRPDYDKAPFGCTVHPWLSQYAR